jgi:hypothetical protein
VIHDGPHHQGDAAVGHDPDAAISLLALNYQIRLCDGC